MERIQRNPDERDVRYFKLVFGRTQGADDEQIVKDLDDPDIDSPRVLYRRLKVDGFPICPMCGTTHVEEGHCKPPRKARRGAGERQDLPSAAEAIPLFNSVVKALDSYLVDLTTLKEVYRDERFEAVDHYEVTALVDLENNITTYGQGTLPEVGRVNASARCSIRPCREESSESEWQLWCASCENCLRRPKRSRRGQSPLYYGRV